MDPFQFTSWCRRTDLLLQTAVPKRTISMHVLSPVSLTQLSPYKKLIQSACILVSATTCPTYTPIGGTKRVPRTMPSVMSHARFRHLFQSVATRPHLHCDSGDPILNCLSAVCILRVPSSLCNGRAFALIAPRVQPVGFARWSQQLYCAQLKIARKWPCRLYTRQVHLLLKVKAAKMS